MEENTKKNVDMKVTSTNNQSEGTPKYTYEQLNNICTNLFQENQQLKRQLQEVGNSLNMHIRLDYLLKIVDLYYNNKNNYVSFTTEFIENCIEEIQNALTPVENNSEEN